MIDFDLLDEALEDFAINGGNHKLKISYYTGRDGERYLTTEYITAEDIHSFEVTQPETKRIDWMRR